MQTKIIVFVLFMLSFTVAHDTVFKIMDVDCHATAVHLADEDIHSQETQNDSIDDIHAMFHFVALVTPHKNDFIQLPTTQSLSYNSSTYTFSYKETSDKPPKA